MTPAPRDVARRPETSFPREDFPRVCLTRDSSDEAQPPPAAVGYRLVACML